MAQESPHNHLSALQEIRDRAYILSLGNAYLCEDVFLRKIGTEIASMVKRLSEDIIAIKKRFPGKFADDVDTETLLKELYARAGTLQNPDSAMNDKCAAGELGRELEQTVQDLTRAIKQITAKVDGVPPEFTKKDAVISVLGKAKAPASVAASSFVRLIFKVIVFLLIIALGPFVYLLVTMDREPALLNEVSKNQALIRSHREIIASLEKEKSELTRQIEELRRKEEDRQDKIAIMELEVRAHGLDEKRSKSEVEIANLDEEIKEDKAKVEEIHKKPFIQRLLRR
jgi:septal ring factor EnvC (AmiA/AmiB activator)